VVRLLKGPTLQVEEWGVSGLAFDVGSKRGDYKDFNVFVVSKADIDDPSRASNRNLARDIVEEGVRLSPEGNPA
jgi:hypothetical protein